MNPATSGIGFLHKKPASSCAPGRALRESFQAVNQAAWFSADSSTEDSSKD